MHKRSNFNPKRRIQTHCDPETVHRLARQVRYGGNPEHKRNAGDFGLVPPAQPRADKTLCDEVSVDSRAKAEVLLREGAKKGLISEQMRGGFPQNIWSVTAKGEPLEAELTNQDTGEYHGYPMPQTDVFRDEVLKRWAQP